MRFYLVVVNPALIDMKSFSRADWSSLPGEIEFMVVVSQAFEAPDIRLFDLTDKVNGDGPVEAVTPIVIQKLQEIADNAKVPKT